MALNSLYIEAGTGSYLFDSTDQHTFKPKQCKVHTVKTPRSICEFFQSKQSMIELWIMPMSSILKESQSDPILNVPNLKIS